MTATRDHEVTLLVREQVHGWAPARGDATDALGANLLRRSELPDAEAFDGIVRASVEIVRHCKPFDADDGSRTGLVIGYVQSGKTLSMTAVASLARDNGCRLVVLLAGVTEILLRQTARERLRPYLLNMPEPRRAWRLHDTTDSPDLKDLKRDLRSWVADWRRPDVPDARKRPVFVTVMKHHAHLANLRDALRTVSLRNVPCLVIDDEADQASLDTGAASRAEGGDQGPSTTYQRISEIRASLPNHTYLQYTATPQAPLLVSLADMLSPDFAHVLDPGDGYTGGRAFFVEHRDLIVEIPTDDLFDANSPPNDPPESLVRAMRQYFIGAAAGYVTRQHGHRSMLIHPSQRKGDHETFFGFADRIKTMWIDCLRGGPRDALREECLEDFAAAHQDLKQSGAQLPEFDEIASELPYVLQDTPIWKVNSEDGREVDWERAYGHILVGGDKLNRGFTVKGLSVTYMPRTPGGWNADTIQQRARFFGYKAGYLGLCRVYLHPEVADAYREYVEHEEDIRSQLAKFAGRPLKEWKRAFLLDHRMRPTRSNVLSETLYKPEASGWFRQNYPHAIPEQAEQNRKLCDALMSEQKFSEHPTHGKHLVSYAPLKRLFEQFIVEYVCFGSDAVDWLGIARWLNDLLVLGAEAQCYLVRMNGEGRRERSESSRIPGRLDQLFEGRRAGTRSGAYPGDQAIRDPNCVTIQFHRIDVLRKKQKIAIDVPALAVHFPDSFSAPDVVLQPKNPA